MRTTNEAAHRPCLLPETLSFLAPGSGEAYADCTVGHGYMAEAILRAGAPEGRLLALDIDPAAVSAAQERLARYGDRCRVVHGSYENLKELAAEAGFGEFAGIVIDAGGISTEQLHQSERGLSFQRPGPLSMKLDPERPGPSAADLVNTLSPRDLARLFQHAGESPRAARTVASAIARARSRAPITETTELAALVEHALGAAGLHRGHSHPATRVFLSLRLAVNREMEALEQGLWQALECLRPAGRLVTLSYHGLEHRLVRRAFREMARGCICPPALPVCGCGRRPLAVYLTPSPLSPSRREVERNPSARSARLHCLARTSVPIQAG